MSYSEQQQQSASVSPYLIVGDAAAAIRFYETAFGAREAIRLTDPAGKVGHAELTIGGSNVMLADEHPDFGALSPASVDGTPVQLHLQVDDADLVVARALAAGATLLRPVKDQFHGERSGMIADPFGHAWHVATLKEVVSPTEMQRRWTAALAGEPAGA